MITGKSKAPLELGRQGENLARTLEFDISAWRAEYGEGTVQLLCQRTGDAAPYPAAIEQEGDVVRWPITSADTACAGYGYAQLLYFVGEALVKQNIYMTLVYASLGEPSGEVPEAHTHWVKQMLDQVDDKVQAGLSGTVRSVNGISPDGSGALSINSLADIEQDVYTEGRVPYVETSGTLLCAGEWICRNAGGWYANTNFVDIRSFPALGDKVNASISVNGSEVEFGEFDVVASEVAKLPSIRWVDRDTGRYIVEFVFYADSAELRLTFSGTTFQYLNSGDVVKVIIGDYKETIHPIDPKFLPSAVLDLTGYESFGTPDEPLEMDIDDFLRALYYGAAGWFQIDARYAVLAWTRMAENTFIFLTADFSVNIRNTGTFNPTLRQRRI